MRAILAYDWCHETETALFSTSNPTLKTPPASSKKNTDPLPTPQQGGGGQSSPLKSRQLRPKAPNQPSSKCVKFSTLFLHCVFCLMYMICCSSQGEARFAPYVFIHLLTTPSFDISIIPRLNRLPVARKYNLTADDFNRR